MYCKRYLYILNIYIYTSYAYISGSTFIIDIYVLCIYFIVHSIGELPFPFIILPPPLLFLSLPPLPSSPTFFSPDATSDIQMFMYLVHLNMKHGKLDFFVLFCTPSPVSCLIHNSEPSTRYCFLKKQNYFIYIWFYESLCLPPPNLHLPFVQCVHKQ